jgi:hypothetical protein
MPNIECPECHRQWHTAMIPPGPIKCPECQWRRKNDVWIWLQLPDYVSQALQETRNR